MAWSQTSLMNEKIQFIADYLRGTLGMTELCDHYGISRKTGYKWVDRYLNSGPQGLEDRDRAPNACPHKTPAELEQAIIEARQRHPSWGARKLRTLLMKKEPSLPWPARSTFNDVLKRNGMIHAKRRTRKLGHPGKPEQHMDAPNQTWAADFKGHFKTVDGRYCYPLTITDGYSRYLLACRSLLTTAVEPAKRQWRAVRHQYLRTTLHAIGLVDQTRYLPRTYRARQASTEWTS